MLFNPLKICPDSRINPINVNFIYILLINQLASVLYVMTVNVINGTIQQSGIVSTTLNV